MGFWTAGSPMPVVRGHGACHEVDGKIYYVYGQNHITNIVSSDFNIYDIAGDTWTTKPNRAVKKAMVGSVVCDKKIYIIGGVNTNTSIYYKNVEIYDTEADVWTTGKDMPGNRSNFGCVLINRQIYCISGITANNTLTNKTEIYDIDTNTWSNGASVIHTGLGMKAAVIGKKIYCTGGREPTSNTIGNSLSIYDTEINQWVAGAPMPRALYFHDSFACDGKIYCIGGITGNDVANDLVLIYDPLSNSWDNTKKLPFAGGGTVAALKDNKIFFIGHNVTKSLQIYTPQVKITEKFQTTDGAELDPDNIILLDVGSDYNGAARSYTGYSYVGARVDDGAIKVADTVKLETLADGDYVVTYVYKLGSDTPTGGGSCCCGSLKLEVNIPIGNNPEMLGELIKLVNVAKACDN